MAVSTFILMTEWNSKFTILLLKLTKMQKQQKQLKVLNFTVFLKKRILKKEKAAIKRTTNFDTEGSRAATLNSQIS